MSYFKYASPIGEMLIAIDENDVTGLWFEGQKYFPDIDISKVINAPSPCFQKVKLWLDAYFKGENPDVNFQLSPNGSDFSHLVWKEIFAIPYGKTASYGEIAKIIEKKCGKRVSAQAVGGAVGRNPISVIIPCHRVLGADGSLTGYAGGVERKKFLLNIEKSNI
ncbi:MAG: methylated-DNA--[protein]-cysteine S-methyltransferase [Clostridiales bacterium]|nr:methylated-DNA--[protein]-cysteine S-methyltransferase [Clostridiales bacterium]